MPTKFKIVDTRDGVLKSTVTISTLQELETGTVFYLVTIKSAEPGLERFDIRKVCLTRAAADAFVHDIKNDAELFGLEELVQVDEH